MQTNALIHPQMGMMSSNDSPKGSHHSSSNGNTSNGSSNDEGLESGGNAQETECIPAENVAIIEDIMTEEKLENLRAMLNGNVRKKLYFNPAYFEPHLLAVSHGGKSINHGRFYNILLLSATSASCFGVFTKNP